MSISDLLDAVRAWDDATARHLRGHGLHGCSIRVGDSEVVLTNTQADRLSAVLSADTEALAEGGGSDG